MRIQRPILRTLRFWLARKILQSIRTDLTALRAIR
jgi:hypothetical protein